VIAGIPTAPTLVADGLGQLAALCAAGVLSLDAATRWLGTGSSSAFSEGEPRLPYAMSCDFPSGHNPPWNAIELHTTRPRHEPCHSRVDHADTDVVVLNLCALSPLPPAVGASLTLGDEPGGVNRIIAQLALLHPLAGGAVAAGRGFVRLPAYPWQRESFWLAGDNSAATSQVTAAVESATPVEAKAPHALLGARCNSPVPEWEGRLSTRSLPYLPDHRVQGMTVLPGSGYVELGLAVHHEITGQPQGVLQNLVFHKALVLDDNEPLLRVSYDEQTHDYTVYTQRRQGDKWNLHARGKLLLAPPATTAPIDLEAIQRRCTRFTDGETHYRDMLERGFEYGPYFQGMRKLWLDASGEEVLAWIEGCEQLAAAGHENRLHPTLFDAALQSLLTPLRAKGDTELYIPIGIRELKIHSVPANGFWCHGRLKLVSAGVVEGEATLIDQHGVVIAEASGVRAQALTQKDKDELKQIDQWLYEYVWESAPRPAVPNAPCPAVQPRSGQWLVFADRDDAADLLQQQLEQVICVRPGAGFERQSATRFVVARGSKADLQRVLQNVGAGALAGIIYLWGLDTLDDERALVGPTTPIASAVQLIQAIHSECAANPPELIVVTRGAQAVASERLERVMQAPLVGLARVAANEYSAARLRTIDIDDDSATLAHLAVEILSGGAEDELALRGSKRFVHRMVRKPEADLEAASGAYPADAAKQTFQPEGTHLITGGFGGFGLKIAEWMVGQGVRQLVLVGRNGANQPQAQEAIAKLRERGAEVLAVAADISQESELRNLIARIHRELPPLRGVFHAAAVLDDAPIERVEHRQIDNAMGAKAIGAWHLHRLTQDTPLNYFVLFSSIASLVGGSGQATYAMSCICLDALARFRRDRSLPATSINWGALAQVGMAARHVDAEKHLRRTGVGSFSPSQAVKLFARVLHWNPVELGVALMDWKLWGDTYPGWTASPKFGALLVSQAVAATPSVETQVLRALVDLAPQDRVAAITTVLAQQLADALQTTLEQIDPDKSLISLGVDSLMAMDLQEAIERDFAFKISTLELMKGNNLAALAQQLALWVSAPVTSTAVPILPEFDTDPLWRRALEDDIDTVDAERMIAQLGDLTEEQLDGLLNKLTTEQGIAQ